MAKNKMGAKPIKVLYVCPFAHYSGHHPHVATVEPGILKDNGVDVSLLTFCGIINDARVSVPHIKVLNPCKKTLIHSVLIFIRRSTLPRWGLMLCETMATLMKAVYLKRRDGYDILHLRDGEPFLFLSHIASLPFRGHRWAVSLTAAIVFRPELSKVDIFKRPFVYLYSMALHGVNSGAWRWLYKWSLKRNRFTFMPQNEAATKSYREYMGGIFANSVVCIPWGIANNGLLPDKAEARKHLGLPSDAFVLLSFGAPHSGKDMETIFKAVRECPGVFLVHGGTHTFSLGSNPSELVGKYGLKDRATVFSYYIPEEDKPDFFGAADALIMSYTKAFASSSSMMWESSKYRLPVISSDANTLGEDMRRYGIGLLFEAENYKSLAKAIMAFRGLDKGQLDNLKANCGKFVGDYSERRWAERCKEVYKELVK